MIFAISLPQVGCVVRQKTDNHIGYPKAGGTTLGGAPDEVGPYWPPVITNKVAPPMNVNAELKDGVVVIRWDPCRDSCRYVLYRDDGQIKKELTVTGEEEEVLWDNTIKKGNTYIYTVSAFKGGLNSALLQSYPSNPVVIRVPD